MGYIQVKVDVENLRLKVSRRTGGVWYNNIDTVDLPDSVLDLSRFGPVAEKTKKPEKTSKDPEMEVEDESVQG
jgi:hypothetical protein